MYNHDTELLFPPRLLPVLRELRGTDWRQLVDRALSAPESAPERVAMVLMLVRLNGCLSCNADAFRALHGCTQCAQLTLQRFRGTDGELAGLYEEAREEVDRYLHEHTDR